LATYTAAEQTQNIKTGRKKRPTAENQQQLSKGLEGADQSLDGCSCNIAETVLLNLNSLFNEIIRLITSPSCKDLCRKVLFRSYQHATRSKL